MGSGKSYTGKYLSAMLDIPFVDMDAEIEEAQSKSISDIFEELGEPYFRNLERKYLEDLDLSKTMIIATGGGVPCFGDNIQLMNRLGTTIFIDSDKDTIVERLMKGLDERPLLKGMNRFDLEFFYDSKMEERRPFYEQSNFQIRHKDMEVIADLIRSLM